MKRFLRSVILFSSLFTFSAVCAQFRKAKQGKDPVNFKVQEIVPGVWACIQNDQYGKAICNAGIIDLGDKTLVFDPFMTPEAARELKDVAEQLTKRPVSLVINSHFHNDHIRGNQIFTPGATVISTHFTRNEIARVEPEEQKWEEKHAPTLLKALRKRMSVANAIEREELPLWIGYYEGMVESSHELQITLPDLVFNDSLWLIGTKRSVKLVECKDGHTASDAVMILPEDGIIFMGDLLFTERHPWIADGKVASWQATLKKYYEDPLYTTYVPGHGPVSDKSALQELYRYLGDIQKLCNTVDNDSIKHIVMNQPILQPYRHWYFGKFYEPNLEYLINIRFKEKELLSEHKSQK
ncbi:MAG TPA: MBL fold metallo-hydrolase [Flavitalea sp.]|nr:MBL fold metallo-hydrolase [Flavitalea sp.]